MTPRIIFVIAMIALLFSLIALALTINPETIILPTSRPTLPINGTFIFNLTDNTTEVYGNGVWHYSGNGTAKP